MNFTSPSEFELPGRCLKRYVPGFVRSMRAGSIAFPERSTTSMLVRERNPGSFITDGRVSPFAMLGGTFQYGENTMCVISSLKIGVGVPGLPTTTRIVSGTVP